MGEDERTELRKPDSTSMKNGKQRGHERKSLVSDKEKLELVRESKTDAAPIRTSFISRLHVAAGFSPLHEW